MSDRTIDSQRAVVWSLLLCLWIAVLPTESDIIYAFCANGQWGRALLVKGAMISIVLSPIAAVWTRHGSFDSHALRSGRVITLAIVIGIKLAIDGSAIIMTMLGSKNF